MRMHGRQAKGYFKEDCTEAFRRYIPQSEKDAFLASLAAEVDAPPTKAAAAQSTVVE